MRFFRRRERGTQPIGEAEAYARLHGDRGDEIIRVQAVPPPPPPEPSEPPASALTESAITGESLRRAFERRLDRRST